MTRERSIRFASLAGVAALALGVGLLAARSCGSRDSAAPGAGADRALRAEVYVVAASPVQETVKTVGTLMANESVRVVSELSRRLVAVEVAEGTEVEKGALLFKLDDADLRAQLAELQVQRDLAARTEQRQRALLEYEKKALSQQAYDQASSELRALEAQIDVLRVTLAKTEIRAPFHARVGLRRVSEGAWVTPETPLTTLQDTSRLKIDFSLPERYAGRIAVGQPFHFSVTGRGESFAANVVAVEPAIDAPSRSLLVRGLAENPSGALLPGAFATVEVPLERDAEGILVPAEAVVPSATGHSVYVLRDGRVDLQEVQIGLRTRESVEVLRGLALGDTVVTTNLLRLRPGVLVEPIAAERGAAR
jgi:membrane fusion protein (multidrug efflux system)